MVSVNLHVTFPWSILLLGDVLPKVKLFAERTNKKNHQQLCPTLRLCNFQEKDMSGFFLITIK